MVGVLARAGMRLIPLAGSAILGWIAAPRRRAAVTAVATVSQRAIATGETALAAYGAYELVTGRGRRERLLAPTGQELKSWSTPTTTFVLTTTGLWVFQPKTGTWIRARRYTNIVISSKDIYRAKRLVRTSVRLSKLRHRLHGRGRH